MTPPALAVETTITFLAGVSAILGQLQGALSSVTPFDIAVAGGSGVLTVAVVRWLVKRAAPSFSVPESTTAANVSSTAPVSYSPGKSDVAFTLPAFLPVSKGIREVSHHEVHAFELGLMVGVVLTWLASIGRTTEVATILVVFVAGALGYRRYSSKAFRTVRHEPWYGLMALGFGSLLGFSLFMADPTLPELLGVV